MFVETRDNEMALYWADRREEAARRSERDRFKLNLLIRIESYGDPPFLHADPECIRSPWSKMGAYVQKPRRRWVWFQTLLVLDQFEEDELLDILESRAKQEAI